MHEYEFSYAAELVINVTVKADNLAAARKELEYLDLASCGDSVQLEGDYQSADMEPQGLDDVEWEFLDSDR